MEFKYISNITNEELRDEVVIPCIDEEGFSCILIKNSVNKTIINTYNTDNLEIKLNRTLIKDNESYYFHIIKTKKIDSYSRRQFEVIFNYIFKKITSPTSDVELAQLITSLEDYFKTTPDQDKTRLQIGVYGELLTLINLYNNGYTEIVNKYHTNFYSKHDVEISEKIRLEIKSVVGDQRIHTFKHDQICRDDIDVYVSSLILERSKEGVSLFSLFEYVKTICTNPDLLFALEKLMIKCGLNEEDQGLRCSYELALKNMIIFEASSAPHLDKYGAKVSGVSNISYDVDCELATPINIQEIINIFRTNLN